MSKDVYQVDFLFQGLFLFWPNGKKGIRILLPKADVPEPCLIEPRRALREHLCFLELPVGSRWNRSDFADRVIESRLPGGPLRELLPIRGFGNQIGVLNSNIGEPKVAKGTKTNTSLKTGKVEVVDDDKSQDSVRQLGRFEDKLARKPLTLAEATFKRGRVTSERRSCLPGEDRKELLWIEMPHTLARLALAAGDEAFKELIRLLKPTARPLNLDLRVAMTIPAGEALRVDVPGEKELVVQPPGPDKKGSAHHVLVVRNQEPSAILVLKEGNEHPDLTVPLDRDQEHYEKLARRGFDRLQIAVSELYGGLSPEGSGCGGFSGGG